MPCFKPLKAYKAKTINPSGKRGIVFNPSLGYADLPIEIPCGQCTGCKLELSRQWAVRIMHESQMHEDSAFITMTYSEEQLPESESIDLRTCQPGIRDIVENSGSNSTSSPYRVIC